MQFIRNLLNRNKTATICCYYNFKNNPYRLKNFYEFFGQIKTKDFYIIELSMSRLDSQLTTIQELYPDKYMNIIGTQQLWQKEALLNILIQQLDSSYKNVLWLDADVIFHNKNWYNDTVEKLKTHNFIQLFSHYRHLTKEQSAHTLDLDRLNTDGPSFGFQYSPIDLHDTSSSPIYQIHGHVGFAWGAKLSILKELPLYDRAVFGGADHIMAHAAAGHINHICIEKTFADQQLEEVRYYSKKLAKLVNKKLTYTPGTLSHLWHGDLEKRDYFNRIKNSSPEITSESLVYDENNLLITNNLNLANQFNVYMDSREDTNIKQENSTHANSPEHIEHFS